MKKETSQIVFLFLLLTFGLGYSYYTYLFIPEWQKIKTINQELATQQAHLEQLVEYQRNLQSLESEIKNLEAESAQLAVQIPTSLDKPQLTYYVYNLAKATGVQPQSLSFDQPTQSANYQSISMNFSCQGNVVDILALIKKMQSDGAQKLSIQSVNLTNQQGNMRADLKLIAYASGGNVGQPLDSQTNMQPVTGINSIREMFQL
jgi:Tfp pilus assembly protein PilO